MKSEKELRKEYDEIIAGDSLTWKEFYRVKKIVDESATKLHNHLMSELKKMDDYNEI